jgi:hypothetical protein
MPWYAIEAIDDAVEPTKSLLVPVDVRTWLKLAVVVFFLGGAGGVPPTGFQFSTSPDEFGPGVGPTEPLPPELVPSPETLVTIAVAAFLLGVGFAVVFALVGSVMEFVFVESLRARAVAVRRYADDNLGKGLRLFGFRLVVFLLVVAPTAVAALAVFSGVALGTPAAILGALLVFLPVLLVSGVLLALVDGFTTEFVVPVMLLRDDGVLGGWRAFLPTLRAEWRQFAVYALLRVALTVAAATAVSIVGGVVATIVAVPFAVLFGLLVVAFGGPIAVVSSALGIALAVLLVVALLVAVGIVLAVVSVPVAAYLRYYSLLVLGDANVEFDLIPTLREETRQ